MEGVFERPRASSACGATQGELVDRLMAKIAELETKLYEKELASNQFIPAVHAKTPSRTSFPPANKELLTSLGDPDKHSAALADSNKKDWLAAVPSWLSKSSLARTAIESLASPADGAAAVNVMTSSAGNTNNSNSSTTPKRDSGRSSSPVPAAALPAQAAASDCVDHNNGATGTNKGFKHTSSSGSTTPRAASAADAGADSKAPAGSAGIPKSSSNTALSGLGSTTNSSGNNSQPKWRSSLKHYYRYYLPSNDVDDETGDLTQRVQEAAGAALAEANERLMEAEMKVQAALATQQQLQQQVAAAEQLAGEVEQLKAENLEAWKLKYELEGQMASYKANLEGLARQGSSMQQELEDMRKQSKIWGDANSSEMDKVKAESQLLRSQLAGRSSELSSLRQQLTAVECERDRALQEKQQALEERDKLLAQMQQLTALQQQLAAASAAAAAATSAAADWEEKFLRERAVRRRLHEQLQVLRGNIRVMCRVRPPQQQQQQSLPSKTAASAMHSSIYGGSSSCISFPLEGLLAVHDVATARQREFEFDAVFGPEASQQQVFEEVSPLVRSCADGYNVCIFAYGQTGSGKTYTMEGPHDSPGINTRALQELFSIASDEVDHSWCFHVAMLEIYNEAVRDLLAMSAATAAAGGSSAAAAAAAAAHTMDVSGLPAGELPANMDRVPGLVWRKVSNVSEVQSALREGARARATAATALNAASSRSHALVAVKVQGVREGKAFASMLHLVDLAGSERVDKSEVTGQQLKEAQAINKSLSALGDVMAALQRRGAHIPFRNSKLTQVLQDSLCGTSKVLLVCNLSPEPASSSETLSSLNFASRAAQVELGQARRVQAAAAAAGGSGGSSSSLGVDAGGDAPESSAASTSGATSHHSRSNSCSSAAAAAGMGAFGASGDRSGSSSPSPTRGGSVAAGGRSSLPSTAMAAAATAGGGGMGRPSSRLSDRAAAAAGGGGLGAGSAAGSPKIGGPLGAKPARH